MEWVRNGRVRKRDLKGIVAEDSKSKYTPVGKGIKISCEWAKKQPTRETREEEKKAEGGRAVFVLGRGWAGLTVCYRILPLFTARYR